MSRTFRSPLAVFHFIAILGLAFATSAQSPIDQDWTKWSSDVCMKILTVSPWVTTAQPQDPKNVRRAVLLSSLLVREAMLRQLQIHQKYDTMSPEKRKEFDQQNATCLTSSLDRDYIVIRVWGDPPLDPKGESGQLIVSDRVKARPINRLPIFNFQAPVPCGGESFPWQYVPSVIDKLHDDYNRVHSPVISPDNRQLAPTPAIDFIYPRMLDGKALIQPGDRTMVFDSEEKGGQFTFHLADLVYKDKLDF